MSLNVLLPLLKFLMAFTLYSTVQKIVFFLKEAPYAHLVSIYFIENRVKRKYCKILLSAAISPIFSVT